MTLTLYAYVLTVYRNKRLSKGKKGLKKRTQDPFTRKDWYSVKVISEDLSLNTLAKSHPGSIYVPSSRVGLALSI